MESYRIEWKRSATKELRRLPKAAVPVILRAADQLSSNPYPPGARKLAGPRHTYRIREGAYRIIYNVLASVLVVEIVRVRHRKDAYDR